ncbi:hypothetical protein [Synechococcus phage S-8S29]|nr:hypothetical protein [Synechococcus phage S-8S29]|tara:strand:+ start:45 stop:218 length:174 start_codon:yes stop_codon:yes gene_type:complete
MEITDNEWREEYRTMAEATLSPYQTRVLAIGPTNRTSKFVFEAMWTDWNNRKKHGLK